MGADARTSVVDANSRVHDCPNLFLSGSEVFATGAAVQPVLTITALAHRLGDHLAELLARGAPAPEFNAATV
jgi:choline dehydrogenase-like flavoprotein